MPSVSFRASTASAVRAAVHLGGLAAALRGATHPHLAASTVASGDALAARACTLAAGAPRRLTTADGARVLVDPTSVAVSGGAVLLTSPSVATFRAGGPPSLPGTHVGVVVHPGGAASLVPPPAGIGPVGDVHAVAASDGGWHVVLVEGVRGMPRSPRAYARATVWYARLGARGWSTPERAAEVRAALATRSVASNVAATAARVAFAFPFDRSQETGERDAGSQGIVLLVRSARGWTMDTLRTWAAPESVQLLMHDGGGITALYSSSYFHAGRPRGPALHRADHAGAWRPPVVVHDPSPRYVSDVALPAGAGGGLVTWRVADRARDPRVLEWGVLDAGSLVRRGTVAELPLLARPAVVAGAGGAVVVVGREDAGREALTIWHGDPLGLHRVGTRDVPLLNYVTHAAVMPDGRVMAVTGGRDSLAGGDPPYGSYLTDMAVGCGAGRR